MKLSAAYTKKLIAYAKTLVGIPYERGAQEKNILSFDCSSFIQHVFRHVGIDLPRSSILQAAEPQGVLLLPQKNKTIAYRPGDVLFMSSDRGYYFDEIFAGKHLCVGHVALYIGNDRIIHSKKSAKGVVIESLKNLQKNKIYKTVAVRRYTKNRPVYAVPTKSQHTIRNQFWKSHACGIVALGMVLTFYNKKFGTYDKLLNQGIKMKIRKEGVGWTHAGLVRLANTYGLRGNAYDWSDDSEHEAFLKMASFLEYGPVIASIHKNFNPKNGGHLIVLTGYKDGYVYYNEPNSIAQSHLKRKIKKDKFLAGWKQRIIQISPPTVP